MAGPPRAGALADRSPPPADVLDLGADADTEPGDDRLANPAAVHLERDLRDDSPLLHCALQHQPAGRTQFAHDERLVGKLFELDALTARPAVVVAA